MVPAIDFKAALSSGRYALAPDILLTADGCVTDHALVVSDGTVEAVAPVAELDAPAVRLPGRAIIPGFVDAHTHVGQIFGKLLIGGEPAQIWKRIWHPMESAMGAHESYVAAKWACLEALRGGFTALVNYGLNPVEKNEAVHKAATETGMRIVSACGLDEGVGAGKAHHELAQIFAAIDEHVEHCAGQKRIVPSVCCGSFAANSAETLTALSAYCAERGLLLQMHSNQHFPEVHDCVTRYGKRPIELLDSLGVLGPHVLLHHTTIVSENEIEILARTRTGTSYNPLAAVWKGNAITPAYGYAQRGVRFGIGSDDTTEDAFRILTAAETCQRIEHAMPVMDFSCGAGWTWVEAATAGSADVAGGGDTYGRLAPGMDADFLVLDMMRPECLPSHDFEWELVRCYNRDQIEAVVTAGALRMLHGHPVDWDDVAFMTENLETAKRIASTPGITRLHGPSRQHRPKARR